ncbi:hypothetical protein FEF65_06770 [Mariprofundus erugo]|uniref:D-amino acid aminotransferase n=1 Tax=Mariprofundus erugo TaxID=2528639 RepID=A0A5R9GNP3_9PROT|nr:aminotransferase class IV [Mariprofundus erugo]TLS67610.1 hypothetical protein FEF65_06770 [Mariprofundus erugo]
MPLTAWVNGHFVPLEQAVVHIEDRGFQFADGVYEVIACFSGAFLDLDAHLSRLQRSCDAVAIRLPRPMGEIEQLIAEVYARNPFPHAMIYIQITRGISPRSHHPAEPIEPTLVITARELPEPGQEKIEKGAYAITLRDMRWQRCDIKSIALLASVLGELEAARAGADECFWLDEHGHMLEGCASNCLAVIDGVLVTHPLDHHILDGMSRRMTLRLAVSHGIAIEQRPWQLNEPGLSECMMCSTTDAIMPVCRVDEQIIGSGHPGPVATSLRQWMLEEFEQLRTGATQQP